MRHKILRDINAHLRVSQVDKGKMAAIAVVDYPAAYRNNRNKNNTE